MAKGRVYTIKPGGSERFGCAFMSLFSLAILAWILYRALLVPHLQMRPYAEWTEIPCTIQEHWAEFVHESNRSERRLEYRYAVAGREYTGTHLHPLDRAPDITALHRDIERYPEQSAQTCFVNPVNPGESYLSLEDRREWMALYVGAVLAAAALLGLAAALFLSDHAGGPANWKPSAKTLARGRLRFTSRRGQITEGLLFLAFGLLSLAAPLGYTFYYLSHPEMDRVEFAAMSLLGAILLLAGLVLSWLTLRRLLRARQPRPLVWVDPPQVRLGETAALAWRFKRGGGKVRLFRMWLEGCEEVITGSSRHPQTESVPFERIPILEATEAMDAREGRVQFTVPTRSLHSLHIGAKKVVWRICIACEIGNLPGIVDQAELVVLPRDGTIDAHRGTAATSVQ